MNLLDFIFPKKCLECGKNGKYICLDCVSQVLDGTFDENNFAVFKYRGVIRKAIISLKYKFAYDIADELIEETVKRIKSKKYHGVTLVPIPLFWRRENFRGFNQSEILGKKIAQKMNWKFIPDLLIRNKNTKPQVGLRGLTRHSNLSGVFSVNPIYNLLPITCNLILFDDVYTTGSTIKEARKVLEKAGFNNVYSLTIAR
ncbi:MAG: ComF family protein [Patescibacteria group bacterium]